MIESTPDTTKVTPQVTHFSLRPVFVLLVGLLVPTLYFVWAFYGAAPTSLRLAPEEGAGERAVTPTMGMDVDIGEMDSMPMGGHGAEAGAMSPGEFEEIVYRFVDDLTLEDGSVRPTRDWMEAFEAEESGTTEEGEAADGHAEADEPIVVYMMAQRFPTCRRCCASRRGSRTCSASCRPT